MNISAIIYDSAVDGPGIRSVVFAQGCSHHCVGCHNPETWEFNKGRELSVDEVFREVDAHTRPVVGKKVTLSGGDPICQLSETVKLVSLLKSNGYHICVYTGFVWEDIICSPSKKVLPYIDMLIDGPFIIDKKSYDLRFRGSSNQRIIDVQSSLSKGHIVISNLNK